MDASRYSKFQLKKAEAEALPFLLQLVLLIAKLLGPAPVTAPSSPGHPGYSYPRPTHKPPAHGQTEGSLLPAFPQPELHSTEPINRDPTHNPNPYGSVDSTTSPPNETWSPESSPTLQQEFPKIFPDGYGQRERRSSQNSLASTLESSPRPVKRRPKQNRKPRATQADAVLLNFLAPDQPQIALRAGETPLFWPGGSDNETEMEVGSDGHDGEDGGGVSDSSRSVSRKQSTEQLNGGLREPNDGESSGGVGSGAGGEGGGDERKGNSGGGKKGDGGRGGGRGKDENKDEGEDENEDEEDPPTIGADEMEVDNNEGEDFAKGGKISRRDGEGTGSDRGEGGNGGPMVVEPSLTETAETAVSLIALAAGDDRQQFSSTTPLPEVSPKVGGGAWAPAGSKSPNGPQNRAAPSSSGQSNQLFHNNKLPPPNSPTPLPSMHAQPASSPNSLPSGHDGRHTTLPSVSTIREFAGLAAKESPQQQQSPWANNGMPPNPRTVYPTVSSHVSVAPSNRSTQAPQSPGLPPPSAHSPHGFGPNSNPRPPLHHLTLQQRQFYMNPENAPYYPHHHPHYQSPLPPMKEVAQPNGSEASAAYTPSPFQHPRDLPGVVRHHPSPTANANYFAQAGISGRRDSTSVDYYPSEHTPPSGPSTGETMASSGTEDTIISSPRNRSGMASGNQGGGIIMGGFKCEFQGCKAPPFQTQYLLK